MKKIAIIILLSLHFSANANKVEGPRLIKFVNTVNFLQDTTLSYILSLDLSYYRNKPVDTILNALPTNYSERVIHGMGNLKIARVLSVRYPGNIRVLIFVKDFSHMNPRNENCQWDINLFKQENVECIEVWNGTAFVSSIRCQQR
jgi:uncharacterized membrane protein